MLFFFLKNATSAAGAPGSGDAQQEEKDAEGDETKTKSATSTATKKKKKEIDLPITSRVPSASRNELDRLIEQEVKYSSFLLFIFIMI
jgi:hypothetical protein